MGARLRVARPRRPAILEVEDMSMVDGLRSRQVADAESRISGLLLDWG